ncbi:MAG: response regulator [Candidatus Omnitrophota bacterium]
MNEQLLKVKDVMARLNISRRTVYHWIEEGILKPIRLGHLYRFDPRDLDQLIESGRKAAAPQPKKILVVDDDILVHESIRIMLSRAGYSVTVAHDGKTAVQLSQREDFNLTLTDMRMPGMDGLETLKAIRRVREKTGREIRPEVIMTAYEDSHARNEAETIGVKNFIMKPFELDYFLEVIKRNIA